MQSLVILAALSLFGQSPCSSGNCPSPMNYGPAVSPARNFVIQPQATATNGIEGRDFYVVRKHRIRHEGMSVVVEGFLRESGTVTWNPESPFNARSIAAAKASRVEKPAAPIRVPSAEPGPPVEPPSDSPVAAPPAEPAIQNFGVVASKVGHGKAYTAPSDEAKRFIAEAQSPTESLGRLHVTVIGTDDAREAVINDLETHPALSLLKPLLMVQGYKPGDWAVDPSLGFQSGKPAIVVQTAKGPGDPKGGRVVFRAADYSMGPEKLAEALRKADPHYKPGSDPGPHSPGTSRCPLGFTRDHWALIVIAVLAVLVALCLPKKGV